MIARTIIMKILVAPNNHRRSAMIYYKKSITKYSAFTLIEVLITLVILSIGLLGMAGIQIQGLRSATGSSVRTEATLLANDLAERIHMNFDGVFIPGAGTNAQYSAVSITNQFDCTNAIPPACSDTPDSGAGGAISCTPASMALFDIIEFACGSDGTGGVKGLLPGGSATISCTNSNGATNCPPGSQLTINISWLPVSTANNQNNNQNNNVPPPPKTISMVVIP